MELKQLISVGSAAALLCAGAAATPASAHGQVRKEITLFNEFYVEIGRILHYCDGDMELIGSSEGALFQEVRSYRCT